MKGMSMEQQRRNAIQRALARGGAATVRRVRYGLYRVASSSRAGRFHTVTVDARGCYRCDCEAGLAGRVCWAQAAVYIAKTEAAAKGRARVTGPAASSAPALAPVVDIRSRRAA
jgi:hypothetical protein